MTPKRFFIWGAVFGLALIALLVSIRVVAAQTVPGSTYENISSEFSRMNSASYSLDWDVLANSSGVMTSASYRLQSTLGQNAIGTSSSASYFLHGGFWQLFYNYGYLPLILK